MFKQYKKCREYDAALNEVKNKIIPFDDYYAMRQSRKKAIFEYLIDSNLCNLSQRGLDITPEGKLKLADGGFTRQYIKDTIILTASVVAAITGIIMLLITCFSH